MTTLNIHRPHTLGMERARQLGQTWMAEAQGQWGLHCELKTSAQEDLIAFSRSGVSGTLRVTALEFELQAKLGFLMAAFAPAIETQITQNLDALLGKT